LPRPCPPAESRPPPPAVSSPSAWAHITQPSDPHTSISIRTTQLTSEVLPPPNSALLSTRPAVDCPLWVMEDSVGDACGLAPSGIAASLTEGMKSAQMNSEPLGTLRSRLETLLQAPKSIVPLAALHQDRRNCITPANPTAGSGKPSAPPRDAHNHALGATLRCSAVYEATHSPSGGQSLRSLPKVDGILGRAAGLWLLSARQAPE
jgi:hypothetical protein